MSGFIDDAQNAMTNVNNTGEIRRQRALVWAAIAVADAIVRWLDRH